MFNKPPIYYAKGNCKYKWHLPSLAGPCWQPVWIFLFRIKCTSLTYLHGKYISQLWKKHSLQTNIFCCSYLKLLKIYIWNSKNYVQIAVIFKEKCTNWQPEKIMQVKITNAHFLSIFFKWKCWLPLYIGHKKKICK